MIIKLHDKIVCMHALCIAGSMLLLMELRAISAPPDSSVNMFHEISSEALTSIEKKTYPFLWFNDLSAEDQTNTNSYALFRSTFDLNTKPDSATLNITAGDFYKLYVNGKYLGRGPVREAAPWYQYDSYDLQPYLTTGVNVLAVHVYHRGLQTYMKKRGIMGLWAEGEVFVGGERRKIASRAHQWKVLHDDSFAQSTPEWSVSIKGSAETTGWGPGPQEYKDMRKHKSGWNQSVYDDSHWGDPRTHEYSLRLYPRPIPMLSETRMAPVEVMRVGEIPSPYATSLGTTARNESDRSFAVEFKSYPIDELQTVDIQKIDNILSEDSTGADISIPPRTAAYLQVDFGKQVTGYPRLCWKMGKAGIVVDLAYSEDILQTERPNTYFERTYTAGRMILKDGFQEWESAFLVHSFRYMGLVIRNLSEKPAHVNLESLGINFVSYPVVRRGSFWCDDPFLNTVYRVSEWTNRLCMHDLYEDCPRREQVQWVAEIAVQSYTNYYLYGDKHLIRQFLLMGTHRPGAELPSFLPSSDLWDPQIATYPMHFILALWHYLYYTGDREILDTVLPKAELVVDRLLGDLNEKGLYDPRSDRQLFDLPPDGTTLWRGAVKFGAHLHTNCHLLMVLRGMKDMEALVGNKTSSAQYGGTADKLTEAIQKNFWNKRGGYFDASTGGDSSYIALGFSGDAVWSGAATEQQANLMWAKLFKRGAMTAPGVVNAGYIGTFYLGRGLLQSPRKHHGHLNAYYREYYGKMLKAGATTFWESFGSSKLSFVHGASGHFPYFAGSEILGVKPTSPGYSSFRVYPKTLHLGIASGKVPTPHGAIKVYWEWKGDGGYYLSLTVPQNTQCQLFFPDQISVNDVQKANFLQGVSPERIPIPTEGPPLAPNDIPLTPGYKIPPGQYSIHVSR